MTEGVADTFSRHASGYDAARRRLIPGFDGFYGSAIAVLDDLPDPMAVLDLGAGTGLFAALLRDRRPASRVHLVDASDGMLAQARQRFSGVEDVSYATGDMATAELGGPWDAVISALAIHHLDDAGKRALFGRIRQALKPGGWFVNAEQIAAPDPVSEARQVRRWYAAIRAAGLDEPGVAAATERMRHDICASVEDQLAWMRDAGFTQVDNPWRNGRFAVLCGRA